MENIQFPRSALLWLLLSISSVFLPLQLQVPIWTSLIFIIAILWRWMMHLGRWPYPTTVVKVVVVALSITAVIVSAQGRFHLESATTFILVASLLKVLEIKTKRDGYIIIFLSFFLLAVNFLYDQGLLTALYSVFSIWLLISALVGLHQTLFSEQELKKHIKSSASVSAKVLALSVPIMILMFLLFPRFGPLWALNLHSGKAKTGLSERMSPGDIAELSNSDELVFRVEFDGDVPPADTWYWRALVLDRFEQVDGRARWSASGVFNQASWFPNSWQPEKQAGVYDYKIIQEPTDKKWLIGLKGVAAMEAGIGMTDDDRLVSKRKLFQRKEYRVRSWPEFEFAKDGLLPLVRQQSVQSQLLKDASASTQSNPRSRQLAKDIAFMHDSDEARMNYALNYYRQKNFGYTLKPERMLDNDIDKFLFDYQEGFCAHFSSSFVFLMRNMDIPARVVAGYQGGELNTDSGHITVRQYDAHAWAEVWLPNKGWVAVDPTAQVAPDRITLGLQQSLKDDAEFLSGNTLSLIKLSNFPLLNDLRLKLDQLNYYWHQTVLNFNKNRQSSLLKEWFGNDFLSQSLYWLAGLVCAFFFSLSIIILWSRPQKKLTHLQKAMQVFNQRLSRYDLQRLPAEGIESYSNRLQQAMPEYAASIQATFAQIQAFYYQDHKKTGQEYSQVEQKLAKQLKWLSKKLKPLAATTDKSSHRQSHS